VKLLVNTRLDRDEGLISGTVEVTDDVKEVSMEFVGIGTLPEESPVLKGWLATVESVAAGGVSVGRELGIPG
jgi:hypothetical protein